MPYKSKEQAAFLHIHHPEIAKKWDAEGAKVEKKETIADKMIKEVKRKVGKKNSQ